MGTRIVQVEQGSALAEDVFRFRYRIYVEEMGRPQRYADPVAKTIKEPLDRCSTVFAALDDADGVVGTIRYTAADRCPDSEYTAIYRMDAFEAYFPNRYSFTNQTGGGRSLSPHDLGDAALHGCLGPWCHFGTLGQFHRLQRTLDRVL